MTSPTGLTAAIAAALAVASLATSIVLAFRLKRVQSAQEVLLGDGATRDVIAEAAESRRALTRLADRLESHEQANDLRFADTGKTLARAITGFSLVRYDAFDEASGQQSVSIALLDGNGEGVVLSSLVRRDTARMYARLVGDDGSDLSPEEREAVRIAVQRVADA